MHSLKNTFVAVVLLGASYGVYQALTIPDTAAEARNGLESLNPEDPSNPAAGLANRSAPNASEPPALPPLDLQMPPEPNQPLVQLPPESTSPQPDSFDPDSSFSPAPTPGEFEYEKPPALAEKPPAASQADPLASDRILLDELKRELQKTPPRQDAPFQPPATEGEDPFEFLEQYRGLTPQQLADSWYGIDEMVDQGKFRPALASLTRFYPAEAITGRDREKLHQYLNALAGKVIYSPEHHFINRPVSLAANQTLDQLADRWSVSPELIYFINQDQIANPLQLVAGTEVKIVNGPFHAQVDLSDQMLTLFIKGLFAGQFRVVVSSSMAPAPGRYGVMQRVPSGSGNAIGAPDRIVFNGNLQLLPVDQPDQLPAGCLGLSPGDAPELFAILSEASQLLIQP